MSHARLNSSKLTGPIESDLDGLIALSQNDNLSDDRIKFPQKNGEIYSTPKFRALEYLMAKKGLFKGIQLDIGCGTVPVTSFWDKINYPERKFQKFWETFDSEFNTLQKGLKKTNSEEIVRVFFLSLSITLLIRNLSSCHY